MPRHKATARPKITPEILAVRVVNCKWCAIGITRHPCNCLCGPECKHQDWCISHEEFLNRQNTETPSE